MIPEFFNIVEAALYITSSFYYDRQDTESDNPYLDDYTLLTHNLETAAAVISCVASFGWVGTWWITYLRTPGRGAVSQGVLQLLGLMTNSSGQDGRLMTLMSSRGTVPSRPHSSTWSTTPRYKRTMQATPLSICTATPTSSTSSVRPHSKTLLKKVV